MSSKTKKSLYGQPSTNLLQQYNEVCFRLGQEIANERRSIENQETLKDQQKELEEAFNAAKIREDEASQQKAKFDVAAKEAKDKAVAAGTSKPEEPPAPEAPSA